MPEQNTVPRVWAEEWRTRYGQALASLQVAEARIAELEAAGPVVVTDADRWFTKVRDLATKLEEMELHDDTGDPYDMGYMRAVREMQAALKGQSVD